MQITVIGGSGYVGFVTGLGFAELGNDVVNVDIDAAKVEMMNGGCSPIYEEDIDLNDVLQRNLDAGRIEFTTDLEKGMSHGEIVFIAVGTPEKQDGEADLSQVIDVAEGIGAYLDEYKVLVMKSTVPVGTLDLVCSILGRGREEGAHFDVASNPEFLREGRGLYDFFHPDRIVLGTTSERASAMLRELYEPFLCDESSAISEGGPCVPRTGVPLVQTDIASAQMVKYAANTFLATRISFINEIASICRAVNASVGDVIRGMGFDERIGHHYLQPGIGFGGPCLEKDLKAMIRISENNDYQPTFLKAVLERNDAQIRNTVAMVRRAAGYPLYKKTIAVFGLAFKPGTNDVRTSLSLRIIAALRRDGAVVCAHDPQALLEARTLMPDIDYFENPYEAVEHADVLVILTDWPEYRELDFGKIRDSMARAKIVDGRSLLEPAEMQILGFDYRGVGQRSSGD